MDRAELTGIDGDHRPVALKRMLPHIAENEDMVEAFVREARLASHLRHANVAQTYEFGQVDDAYFIAMELVTGPTLRELLRHCAQTTGPMPIPIALNILNQICDALDYAHNLCDETGQPLGIIHRDVSPSNIIVDEAGVAKLIDFGVAKASAAGMQTMSGMIKGKFAYMAPECLVGDIDARADLFAVGVIAHELLTNQPLFSGADDMDTLRLLRTMPLLPPSHRNPSVPPEIDDIVMTALSRDPEHRWQHATALRTALTTLTQRLGLVCTNQQVVEWIEWAFAQTKAPTRAPTGTPAHALPVQDGRYEALPPRPLPPSQRSPDDIRTVPLRPATPAIETRPFPADDSLLPGDATELLPTGAAPSLHEATDVHLPDDSPSLHEATELLPTGAAPSLHEAAHADEHADDEHGDGEHDGEHSHGEHDGEHDDEHDDDEHHMTLLDGRSALRSGAAAPGPSWPLGSRSPAPRVSTSPQTLLGPQALPLPAPPALPTRAMTGSDAPFAGAPFASAPLADAPPDDEQLDEEPLDDEPFTDAQLADAPFVGAPFADAPLADAPLADAPLADAAPERRPSAVAVAVVVLLAAGLVAALAALALPHLT